MNDAINRLLDDLRNEVLSEEARNHLATKLYDEALRIARNQERRLGSPDGVTGASELANSRVAAIMVDPHRNLGEIHTADELQRALHRILADSWIDRRRKAAACKRGGDWKRLPEGTDSVGNIVSPVDMLASPPTEAELQLELDELLNLFPKESEERVIVMGLIEKRSEEEIGKHLGLSRHSIGRRIRTTIAPRLRKYFDHHSPSDDQPSP
jgi:DNA-directed RNA polymerase specialized sigma24 family protein